MPNIRHELVIAASANQIYTALTSEEGLSGWWTPMTTATPEVGSVARFAFGGDYFKEMKVLELDESRFVRWLCIKGAGEWAGTSISFTIENGTKEHLLMRHAEAGDQLQQASLNDVSVVQFAHDDWKDYTAMFAECNYTWAQFLRSLKLYCETGTGTPWPRQHRFVS